MFCRILVLFQQLNKQGNPEVNLEFENLAFLISHDGSDQCLIHIRDDVSIDPSWKDYSILA